MSPDIGGMIWFFAFAAVAACGRAPSSISNGHTLSTTHPVHDTPVSARATPEIL